MLRSGPQLGKKGKKEAVANWRRGVTGHIAAIRRRQEVARGPERIHIAWQGDESEGVANNYPGQSFTVEVTTTAHPK